jgi:hypothetical protein
MVSPHLSRRLLRVRLMDFYTFGLPKSSLSWVRHQSFVSPVRYMVVIVTISSFGIRVARKYCFISQRKFSSSLALLAPVKDFGSGILSLLGASPPISIPLIAFFRAIRSASMRFANTFTSSRRDSVSSQMPSILSARAVWSFALSTNRYVHSAVCWSRVACRDAMASCIVAIYSHREEEDNPSIGTPNNASNFATLSRKSCVKPPPAMILTPL